MAISRLKKRSEFLRVQAAAKIVTSTMVVHYLFLPPLSLPVQGCRIGYTVTKRCGNAVKRNRIKRRLRAVVTEILHSSMLAGVDMVVVGRVATHDAPMAELQRDMRYAIRKIEKSKPSTDPSEGMIPQDKSA